VANIPSITDIPYFIPKANFEAAIGMGWDWGYEEGNDDDGMMMTFTALSWAADPYNQGSAMPGNKTLTTAEIATVAGVVTAYNDIISDAVATINTLYPGTCGLYDANAMMAGLPTAQKTHFLFVLPQVGGDVPTAAATTYFSLDGVHPNQMGYAMIANGFLTEINALTGSEYEMVDPSNFAWDPTYGEDISDKGNSANSFGLSSRAAEAIENMYR